jgi:hypothetical protein
VGREEWLAENCRLTLSWETLEAKNSRACSSTVRAAHS